MLEVHKLSAIAGSVTFIHISYDHKWVKDIFIFCIASVLLQHIESSCFHTSV